MHGHDLPKFNAHLLTILPNTLHAMPHHELRRLVETKYRKIYFLPGGCTSEENVDLLDISYFIFRSHQDDFNKYV